MKPLHVNKIGDIPLYSIQASYYFFSSIDNKALAEEVLATASDREKRWSNDKTKVHSSYEDVLFDPGSETHNLLNCVSAVADSIGCETYPNFNIFAQVHHQYESTNLHNHKGGGDDIAFVYYVKVPEKAGVLYFELEDFEKSVVQPIESMCVFFPTNLKHGVTKNLSSELRISISGNLRYKK